MKQINYEYLVLLRALTSGDGFQVRRDSPFIVDAMFVTKIVDEMGAVAVPL